MAKVTWTAQALEDISSIAEFISQDSFLQARKWVEALFQRVRVLEKQAFSGHPVAELADPAIKEILMHKYRITYRVADDEKVFILTVHHSKRLLKNNPHLKNRF